MVQRRATDLLVSQKTYPLFGLPRWAEMAGRGTLLVACSLSLLLAVALLALPFGSLPAVVPYMWPPLPPSTRVKPPEARHAAAFHQPTFKLAPSHVILIRDSDSEVAFMVEHCQWQVLHWQQQHPASTRLSRIRAEVC